MTGLPLILMTGNDQRKGSEFDDPSLSLSQRYADSITSAGGIPVILPNLTEEKLIAEAVRKADGILLTGGSDIAPRLYARNLPQKLARTVHPGPFERDFMELVLIQEAFRQKRPLLAICRGHQILNVALGGTLLVDLKLQMPAAINHQCLDRKDALVHEVHLAKTSWLAKISRQTSIGANSSHHQAIGQLAPCLEATGWTSDGIIEAVELKREAQPLCPWLISVQYHPERLQTRHPVHKALFLSFTKACKRELIGRQP